jgi:hypothetical protein
LNTEHVEERIQFPTGSSIALGCDDESFLQLCNPQVKKYEKEMPSLWMKVNLFPSSPSTTVPDRKERRT